MRLAAIASRSSSYLPDSEDQPMPDDQTEFDATKPAMASASPLPLSLMLSGVTVAVGSVEICSEVSLEVDAG